MRHDDFMKSIRIKLELEELEYDLKVVKSNYAKDLLIVRIAELNLQLIDLKTQ